MGHAYRVGTQAASGRGTDESVYCLSSMILTGALLRYLKVSGRGQSPSVQTSTDAGVAC